MTLIEFIAMNSDASGFHPIRALKEWFKRSFGNHDSDLLLAARMMRAFPKTMIFNCDLVGMARIDDGLVRSFDACTWLAYTRKFHHLGLRILVTDKVVVPTCGRWTMLEAVRRAFRLTPDEFNVIFHPSSYGHGLPFPEHYAQQLEALALSRKR